MRGQPETPPCRSSTPLQLFEGQQFDGMTIMSGRIGLSGNLEGVSALHPKGTFTEGADFVSGGEDREVRRRNRGIAGFSRECLFPVSNAPPGIPDGVKVFNLERCDEIV